MNLKFWGLRVSGWRRDDGEHSSNSRNPWGSNGRNSESVKWVQALDGWLWGACGRENSWMRCEVKPFRSIKNTSLPNSTYFIRTHRNKRMQTKYIRRVVCGRGLRVRLGLKGNILLTYPVLNKQERSHENNQIKQNTPTAMGEHQFFVKRRDFQ